MNTSSLSLFFWGFCFVYLQDFFFPLHRQCLSDIANALNQSIFLLLLASASPAPPLYAVSLGLCFVLSLSCTPFICLPPPKDSTSGPRNPSWGHPVTLWELEKRPLWKMSHVLGELTSWESLSVLVWKGAPCLAGSSMLCARFWMLC